MDGGDDSSKNIDKRKRDMESDNEDSGDDVSRRRDGVCVCVCVLAQRFSSPFLFPP